MGILATNVLILRTKIGLSAEQLATRLGVGKTTINNLESGYVTAPPEKLLRDLACTFATTVDGLMGKSPLDINERARLIYVFDAIDVKNEIIEYDKIVGSVFIDRDKLRKYEHIGLRAIDNSMANRRILAGDIVIVRKNCPIKNNEIVLVSTPDSDAALLRTYFKKGDKIILKAESDSDLYRDIIVEEGNSSFKLIGKVVKCEFEL